LQDVSRFVDAGRLSCTTNYILPTIFHTNIRTAIGIMNEMHHPLLPNLSIGEKREVFHFGECNFHGQT
jgi:hypothetical protein